MGGPLTVPEAESLEMLCMTLLLQQGHTSYSFWIVPPTVHQALKYRSLWEPHCVNVIFAVLVGLFFFLMQEPLTDKGSVFSANLDRWMWA